MLTMDWKDLQYRKPKPIKKKVKQKKGTQTISVKYPLGKTTFSASNWEEYQQWIKQQKKEQLLQEKASEALKNKKGKTTKAKGKKVVKTSKKATTLKEQYQEQLEHPLWTRKRNAILNRDNHTCLLCGSKENLHVHHTRYIKGNKAWEYPNAVLVTLCSDCHKKVHANVNHDLNPYKNN